MRRRGSLYANLAGVDVGDGFPVRLVGAINVSPESFYAGSVVRGRHALRRRAEQMVREGADILDLGAMSTAPYRHGHITEDDEVRRIDTAVRTVRAAVSVPISVDTQRSRVAAAALAAGADIVNDVSGLGADPAMAAVARRARGVILMAKETAPSRGRPTALVAAHLRRCLARARAARIAASRIVLDPGFGFFRQASVPWDVFDCTVLATLQALRRLGHPLLVGVSRKSFIGALTGEAEPGARLAGSLAATAVAVYNGAALVRTHDVAATADAVRVAAALRAAARSLR